MSGNSGNGTGTEPQRRTVEEEVEFRKQQPRYQLVDALLELLRGIDDPKKACAMVRSALCDAEIRFGSEIAKASEKAVSTDAPPADASATSDEQQCVTAA